MKAALGIRNCSPGRYCLIVTQENHYRGVPYLQMPNAQLPMIKITKATLSCIGGAGRMNLMQISVVSSLVLAL